MAEEEIMQQSGEQEIAIEDRNLLKEFEEYKKNSVPKERFDRLAKRNEELTHALTHNQEMEEEAQKPKEPNKDKILRLNNELYSDKRKDMTNLDYISKTLELRDAVIEEGGRDPFLPTRGVDKDSPANLAMAERVANGLAQMVEDADGNPEQFNALYQARVEDVVVPGRKNYNFRR